MFEEVRQQATTEDLCITTLLKGRMMNLEGVNDGAGSSQPT
jgi:hypothetical protein